MADAPFPIRIPDVARRPFSDSHMAQRLVQVAQLPAEGRVLGLGGGSSSLALTLTLDYRVDAVLGVPDDAALALENARLQEAAVQDRVEARVVNPTKLPFRDGEFHLAIVESQLWIPPEQLLNLVRRHLVPSEGRLAFTWPVRVGRGGTSTGGEAWSDRTGCELMLPRELLGLMSRCGYEPEDALTLDAAQLGALYEDWAALPEDDGDPIFRDEAKRQLADSRPPSVTWGLVIGRRQEPNERPYQSHDQG